MIHGLEGERDISGTKIAQTCRMTGNSIEVMQNMEWNVLFSAIFYLFGKEAIHIRISTRASVIQALGSGPLKSKRVAFSYISQCKSIP